MLSELYIENIAVIEKASIEFGPGFNVLTGETGAGKSIVIDAIHAVLGQRTSRELVRSGAKGAFVSGLFTQPGQQALALLQELGFAAEEDGSLLLQREIREDGRTACRIGGRPAPVSAMRQLGALLINIHGQHESYGLLSPDNHLAYLDATAVPPSLRADYAAAYRQWRRYKQELDALGTDEGEKARRADLLQYQIDELEAAQLHPGEQAELQARRDRYRNSEKIAAAVGEAMTALDGGEQTPGAASAVLSAAQALQGLADVLPDAGGVAARLQDLGYELEDATESARALADDLEYDPQELDEIESRLDQLYRLSRKYGDTEEDMLAFLERSRGELEKITHSDQELDRLQKACAQAEANMQRLGAQLHAARVQAGESLSGQVQGELSYLDMPGARFVVSCDESAPGPSGCDRVQFLISANPGEPPRPLAKIASGGELSRIMLAIQTVLSGRDPVGTLIFDEVDTGVSGSAAQKIGLKLREAAQGRQVLCVTHLPQIAALGDRQYKIAKHSEGGRTFTQVRLLDHEGRKQELARIIGGAQITPLTLQNAEEMLRLAALPLEKEKEAKKN